MQTLLSQIKNCKICEQHLVAGVNPVVEASTESKIVIVGQAPGRIVHNTGIPWNDKSGDNLRSWLGVDKTTFYNTDLFAVIPMGFCYPGTGKSGDLPPRPECAPTWHRQLLDKMPNVELMLLVGQYAQNYYLGTSARDTLTETVKHYQDYLPAFFPLPHPSPRNNIWQAKNEWFGREVLPDLRKIVHHLLRL
jgi:uracil-DNA glycosylase family 4